MSRGCEADFVETEEEEGAEGFTLIESGTTAVTENASETEKGALATTDWSDPAQLH
jgi:hypothetical protein